MELTLKSLFAYALTASLTGTSFGVTPPVRVAPEAPIPADTTVGTVAKATTPSPFREGEDLTFAIKWGVIKGGDSSLKVQDIETIKGQPTYHVVAEAHSTGLVNTMYHVNDKNEAWLEPQTPRTLRY